MDEIAELLNHLQDADIGNAREMQAHAERCVLLGRSDDAIRIAQWIKDNPHETYRPAAEALLQRPGFSRLRWRANADASAKIAAVQALRAIGGESVTHALAAALMYEKRRVQIEASEALISVGHVAAPAVEYCVRNTMIWPADGMRMSVETLGSLGDQTVWRTLVEVMKGELPTGLSRRHWRLATLIWVAIAPTILFWLPALIPAYGVLIGITILSAGWRNDMERQPIVAAASAALCRLKTVSSIPYLINAATVNRLDAGTVGAAKALLAILPYVGPNQYGMLDERTEKYVERLLSSSGIPLVLALIRALEHIGTGKSVAPLERLAELSDGYDRAPEIRAEARRVLPVLQERKRQAEAHMHLLRPAQSGNTGSETLLRATSTQAENDESARQLLRPGAQDEN